MSSVPDSTPTEPCPIEEGMRLLTSRTPTRVLLIDEIYESAGTVYCRVVAACPDDDLRFSQPRRDVRSRIRSGHYRRPGND